MLQADYNLIGQNYAIKRCEDPLIGDRIHVALDDAKTVVNVGAGAGSYEPSDRIVLAVEPSHTMALQRRPNLLPTINAQADKLPFHDKSVDAAMTVLSLHHWIPKQKNGILEMSRIARKRIVIVTVDPRVSGSMWLMNDYLHEVKTLDNQIFPSPEVICQWLNSPTQIEVLPISRDTPDWNLLSFWAHPERVLDPSARAATSGFARQPDHVTQRVVSSVKKDLENGTWDKRYGQLRNLAALDVGLRLITATLV